MIRIIACLIVGSTVGSNLLEHPMGRVRYLTDHIASLLPDGPLTQLTPEKTQRMLTAMIEFLNKRSDELGTFVSVLSISKEIDLKRANMEAFSWDLLEYIIERKQREASQSAPSPVAPTPFVDSSDQIPSLVKRNAPAALRINEAIAPKRPKRSDEEVGVPELVIPRREITWGPSSTQTIPRKEEIQASLIAETRSELLEIIRPLFDNPQRIPDMNFTHGWAFLSALLVNKIRSEDYKGMKEDFHLLQDLGVTKNVMAKIFLNAYRVLTGAMKAEDVDQALPPALSVPLNAPLIERLRPYFEDSKNLPSKSSNPDFSDDLAFYIRTGRAQMTGYVLSLAQFASVPRSEIANLFQDAYIASAQLA